MVVNLLANTVASTCLFEELSEQGIKHRPACTGSSPLHMSTSQVTDNKSSYTIAGSTPCQGPALIQQFCEKDGSWYHILLMVVL